MNTLDLKNIKKYFSGQKAVDDISLTVKQGSIFGLLGPNGAGKTTLIRMITGIFLPDEGEVLFHGKPFRQMEHTIKIGYMPEERGLYKKMKIGEQAIYLARLKGLSKKDADTEVRKWFRKFEMESWWDKKVEDLSKGMGQKLQFVTTVVHNPSLIILDEPFSGLDPVNSNLIKDEIFQLAENGATIIFSTHRMEQVEEICEHIVLINKGKKILDSTVEEARQEYKENLYQLETSDISGIDLGDGFELIKTNNTNHIIKLNAGTDTNKLLAAFLDKGIRIKKFNEVLPSLNEIFIRLVEGTPTARSFQILNN